eukprot:gene14630-biopygen2095
MRGGGDCGAFVAPQARKVLTNRNMTLQNTGNRNKQTREMLCRRRAIKLSSRFPTDSLVQPKQVICFHTLGFELVAYRILIFFGTWGCVGWSKSRSFGFLEHKSVGSSEDADTCGPAAAAKLRSCGGRGRPRATARRGQWEACSAPHHGACYGAVLLFM